MTQELINLLLKIPVGWKFSVHKQGGVYGNDLEVEITHWPTKMGKRFRITEDLLINGSPEALKLLIDDQLKFIKI